MGNVRLADIAKRAGVSVSAVSKALSGSTELRADTRERICALAREMGYRPAAAPATAKLLGVVLPNMDNPYYANILQGITAGAREYGYTVALAASRDSMGEEEAALHQLAALPVQGFLAVPVRVESYAALTQPTVLLSRFPYRELTATPSFPITADSHSYIVCDDCEGQRLAAKALLDRGLREIYLLLGAAGSENADAYKTYVRLEGYQQALAEGGIPYDARKVRFDVTTPKECYHAVRQICRDAAFPIGLCVTNDYAALGAISAVRDCGRSIPEDVALVGYDDIAQSAFFSPPLTTVHLPNREIGHHGVRSLHEILQGGGAGPSTILLPYLQTRQSA